MAGSNQADINRFRSHNGNNYYQKLNNFLEDLVQFAIEFQVSIISKKAMNFTLNCN